MSILLAGCISTTVFAASARSFPIGSSEFNKFVNQSFAEFPGSDPAQFMVRFQSDFARANTHSLKEFEESSKKSRQKAKLGRQRSLAELKISANLHAAIKKALPKFSLDQGFEFYYATTSRERQCFLQSILIAGILQRVGMDAGVAMVNRNEQGLPTNNGHAVVILTLSDHNQVIVDASEPHPFSTQRGLFVRPPSGKGYVYVTPIFKKGKVPIITKFQVLSGKGIEMIPRVRGLDIPFLTSQFDYYRGERTPGGYLARTKDQKAILRSESYFLRAGRECPENPLVVYAEGRLYEDQKEFGRAKVAFQHAIQLYRKFGWMPDGLLERYQKAARAS